MANKQSRRGGSAVAFLWGLLSGLVIGGLLSLLFAPHRGEITRRKIRRRAEELRDQMGETAERVTE